MSFLQYEIVSCRGQDVIDVNFANTISKNRLYLLSFWLNFSEYVVGASSQMLIFSAINVSLYSVCLGDHLIFRLTDTLYTN